MMSPQSLRSLALLVAAGAGILSSSAFHRFSDLSSDVGFRCANELEGKRPALRCSSGRTLDVTRVSLTLLGSRETFERIDARVMRGARLSTAVRRLYADRAVVDLLPASGEEFTWPAGAPLVIQFADDQSAPTLSSNGYEISLDSGPLVNGADVARAKFWAYFQAILSVVGAIISFLLLKHEDSRRRLSRDVIIEWLIDSIAADNRRDTQEMQRMLRVVFLEHGSTSSAISSSGLPSADRYRILGLALKEFRLRVDNLVVALSANSPRLGDSASK